MKVNVQYLFTLLAYMVLYVRTVATFLNQFWNPINLHLRTFMSLNLPVTNLHSLEKKLALLSIIKCCLYSV